jgi:CO/xanthine dehydrogenase Mo-binding subunit
MTRYQTIGTRTPKPDGPSKVTGQAVYGHDLRLPGMLCGRDSLYTMPMHACCMSIPAAEAAPWQ